MTNGGVCAIDAFGSKTVSFSVCLQFCDQYDGPPRGAGDMIHSAIKWATNGKLKPCGGCRKCRNALNERFKRREKDAPAQARV